jgi:hypothetical protein
MWLDEKNGFYDTIPERFMGDERGIYYVDLAVTLNPDVRDFGTP